MKNLRKLLILVVLVFASVFLLACGDKSDKADKEELANAIELLNIRFKEADDTRHSVTGDLILDRLFGNATITWASDKESVVSTSGRVTRGEDSVQVTLTATIKVNKQVDTKTFVITVLGLDFETYLVSFNASGGSPTPNAQNVREGTFADKPEAPERNRYEFVGWYLGEELFNFTTPITEATSLVAKWDLVEPQIAFNLGYSGADPIPTQKVNTGETATEPPEPERERYEFAGWLLDETLYDFTEAVTEDIVLTASWTQLEALATFDLGYGEENPEDQVVELGELLVEPTVSERDRFEFVGWYLDDELYDFEDEVTKDIHLVAKWNQTVAVVTFDANGGSPTPEPVTMDTGEALAEPAEPSKSGYDFIGWFDGANIYDFSSLVNKDLNLVANWVEADIEISATIVGPNVVTHYIGTRTFNPVGEHTAIDNVTGEEYELIVSSGIYNPDFAHTYNYTIALLLDPSISKEIRLTVKPPVAIPQELTRDEVKIIFWHSNGSAIENKLLQYAEEFEEMMRNDGYNVKVDVVKNGSTYDELRTNVVNAIKGAELPNLVQNYPDHVVEYDENGVIESLTPYIYHPIHGLDPNNPNERLEDIVRAYREENRSNNLIGDYLSFPFNKSTEVVAYNKTFFDAVLAGRPMPETWQELFALVDDILEIKDEQIDQIAANWAASGDPMKPQDIQKSKDEFVPFTYDSVANAFITLTRQFGGQYTSRDPETGKGQVEFINPNTIRMLNFFAKDRGRTFTVPQNWGVDYANAVSFQGTTIFSSGSTGGVRYNNAVNKGFKLYDVGVMPVPYDQQNPSSRTVIQQGTNISLTNKGTADQRLASWLFLKYLTSTDVQADFGVATGYTPVRLSSIETAIYQEFLAKADIELGDSASAMGLSNTAYNKLAEEKLVAMGAKAAAMQTQYMFYDEAFIGSSKAREEVGNAFERVMLATAGSNLETIINNALQAAKEETERVIT